MAKFCKHKNSIEVRGKLSDFSFSLNGKEYDVDFIPHIGGLSDDENLQVEICLDCHTVLNFSPEDFDELIEELNPEESEEEDF